MAQGNYYGFVTGGVSYAATPAVTYQPEQQTYFAGATSQVSQPFPVATQVTQAYPVAAGYETAYTTPAGYSYTIKPQVTTISAAQVNYAPTYAYAQSTTPSYDSTKVYFTQQQQPLQTVHNTQPTVITSSSFSSNARPSIVKQVSVIPSYNLKTVPVAIPTAPKVATAPSFTAAATSTVVASNNVIQTPPTSTYVPKPQQTNRNPRWTSNGFKNNFNQSTENKWRRPKVPAKPELLHFCDVCKISCAGPQAFQDHLNGQRHKKKEALNKTKPAGSLKCDLCNVACSSVDTYTAHVRGAKHQKVVTLYNKLGKPVPSEEEIIASLSSVSNDAKTASGEKKFLDNDEASNKPIGREYIEEVATVDGKVINIHCKLCDCHFTDPTAKEMHLKGRRHRLEYKKKVDPALVVDFKPTFQQKIFLRDKQRKMNFYDDQRMMDMRPFHPTPQQFGEQSSRLMHQGPTLDDQHVTLKHSTIYPSVTELQAIQKIVVDTEKALKLVSDEITVAGKKVMAEKKDSTNEKEQVKPENVNNQRLLKGVMRVGDMAKGLLLKGDFVAELVVLCGEKPTYSMLVNIADKMPKHLEATKGKYEVFKDIKNAGIRVSAKEDPKVVVNIVLASSAIKADGAAGTNPDPPDVLDSTKGLEALAAIRRVRWFQACVSNLQPGLMIIRIFKDLCRRIPTWATLESWPMELLVEKTIQSAGKPVSPGESVRYVFEAIASGILLPSGPGIQDPCEKEPTDTTGKMSNQDREDITASAQHALRLLAFNQFHKVLNMEPLPLPNMGLKAGQKRLHDINADEKMNGKKGKTEN